MRVNEHIGHVVRSSVSSNERWERAREHGSVDAMSQSNTEASYDEFTPVPLTAEALAQLASEDHGLGNVARMMDNGIWNTDGVQDDIRRESIDRDVASVRGRPTPYFVQLEPLRLRRGGGQLHRAPGTALRFLILHE